MNQTAVPRQKSVISGPVLTGAVLPSSLGLGIFSQNVALVHYYPLFLDGFQVAKWNLPGGNWKPLLCALSAINPFLFALCTFKHCHPIPPSVSSSFNSLHLFSQARFSVSPGSCSPLDSPLFPISLQTSTAGIVVFRQYLTLRGKIAPLQPALPFMQPRMAFSSHETTCHLLSDSPSNTNHFCWAAACQCTPDLHLHSWPLTFESGLTITCPSWASFYLLQTIPVFKEEHLELKSHLLKCFQPFPACWSLQI